MGDTKTLLPCPFCGSNKVDATGWASTDSAGPACEDCGGSCGDIHHSVEVNVAAWNARAPSVSHEARIAELEGLLANASLQIKYLHEKFQPAGSGNGVIAQIADALDEQREGQGMSSKLTKAQTEFAEELAFENPEPAEPWNSAITGTRHSRCPLSMRWLAKG